MFEFVVALVKAVPQTAPIVLAGLAGYGVYLLNKIGTNHLHDLPQIGQDITEVKTSMESMQSSLKDIRDGIIVLVDRSRE